MALRLPITSVRFGDTFVNAYSRIVHMDVTRQRGGGHSVMIDVASYARPPGVDDNIQDIDFERYHTPMNTLPPGPNLLAQGYAWVKLQPKFADGVDE